MTTPQTVKNICNSGTNASIHQNALQHARPKPIGSETNNSKNNTTTQPEITPENPIKFQHRNHRSIDKNHFDEIKVIENEISQIAQSGGDKSAISDKLIELLNKPFFESNVSPLEKQTKIFDELNSCPIYSYENQDEKQAADEAIEHHVQKFIDEHNQLAQQYKTLKKISPTGRDTDAIKVYLKSNRSDRANFEQSLRHNTVISNGSSQKMALETFETALQLIKSDSQNCMRVLIQLTDILPHLSFDKSIQRSAQLRGLSVLERALDGLPTNDRAELTHRLMTQISKLSDEKSKQQFITITNLGDNSVRLGLNLCCRATVPLGSAAAMAAAAGAGAVATGLAIGTGGAVAGALLIPAAGISLSNASAFQKQQRGTGLFLLKKQLATIRSDWQSVSPDNKQKLIAAFNNIKNNISSSSSVNGATLKSFFNDSFINPSEFGKSKNSAVEARKKFNHQFIKPFTTRFTKLPKSTSIDGYQEASNQHKRLTNLLLDYHLEASNLGLDAQEFPNDFLTNLIKNTNQPEFSNAADNLYTFFNRLKDTAEYNNPFSKAQILNTIVDMTNRLARGDENFVREFASVARGAREDCQNNARQFFKILTNTVISDKAMKGEDGLDKYESLISLGSQFFNEKILLEVTRDLVTHTNNKSRYNGIQAEIGNAVEIALGNKFNLPNPIKGMGYSDLVGTILTPKVLKQIENEAKKRINPDQPTANSISADNPKPQANQELVDFLMHWSPLTNKILKEENIMASLHETTNNAREKFNDAFDAHSLIPHPNHEQNRALEAAGAEYKAAEKTAEEGILRQEIERLLSHKVQTKERTQA